MTVPPTLAAILAVTLALAAYGYWLDRKITRMAAAVATLIALILASIRT